MEFTFRTEQHPILDVGEVDISQFCSHYIIHPVVGLGFRKTSGEGFTKDFYEILSDTCEMMFRMSC